MIILFGDKGIVYIIHTMGTHRVSLPLVLRESIGITPQEFTVSCLFTSLAHLHKLDDFLDR